MTIALAAVIGQILTFLTVLLGFLFQFMRETRQHRWDTEQRSAIAAETLATTQQTAHALASKTDAAEARLIAQIADNTQKTATAIASKTDAATAILTAQIADNTEVSKKAFKEANDVNTKIHALGLARQLQSTRSSDIAEFIKPHDDDHAA